MSASHQKTGKITSHGESRTMSMPLSENGNPDYCLECIAKMSIRCAWCESSIHIGDPVTLYIPQESYQVPGHAVRYDKDERRFVGCLGWNCACSGADRQGFWIPPGKVYRVPSPIEMHMLEMLMSSGNDDKAVVVRDLSDPSDLGKVI
jgi:hypothetical protein